jgi:hypothetical protein
MPIAGVSNIVEAAIARASGTRQLTHQAASAAPSAAAAVPGDLVARALAILAEQKITADKAPPDPSRRQAVSGDAGERFDLPPRRMPGRAVPLQRRVSSNEAQAVDLPLQQRMLSDGTVVALPIRYFDARCLLATFVTDAHQASGLLEGSGLQTVRQEDGKAVVVLGSFEYRETDIGQYNEFCLGVSAAAPGDPVPALYVVNLPVTTAAAELCGREIWGFNKFVTAIDIECNGKKFSTTLCDPDGAPLLTLEGTRGASVSMPPADVLTFSLLAGRSVKTLVRVVTPFQVSSGEAFVLRLGQSRHPLADNLRALGLDAAHPVLVQHADPFQSLLFPGQISR